MTGTRVIRGVVLTMAGLLAFASPATADPIVGQLNLGAFGNAVAVPDDLSAQPIIGLDFLSAYAVGAAINGGDFAGAPVSLLSFGASTIDLAALDSLTLDFGTIGSFAASSGSVVDAGVLNIQISLLGTFTPGSFLSAFDANGATVTLLFQRSSPDAAITFTGSLVAAPVAVTEPSSVALAFVGVVAPVGLALGRRRS